MKAENTDLDPREKAALLPPAVTRWKNQAERMNQQASLAPPFKVAARPAARVLVQPEAVAEMAVQTEVLAQAVVEPEVIEPEILDAEPVAPELLLEPTSPAAEFVAANEAMAIESAAPAEPELPELDVQPLIFALEAEAPPEITEATVLTLAPEFAETVGGSADLAFVAEPLEMVEFGAAIEPLEQPSADSDEWLDEPLAFAEEIALAAEQEEAEALSTQGAPLDVTLPTDAVPEVSDPVNTAFEPVLQATSPALEYPHQDLAERLAALSGRLRTEKPEALLTSLSGGDRLDVLMAGFLSGYLSARQ